MFSIHDLTAAWFECETKCKERDNFFHMFASSFFLRKESQCWVLAVLAGCFLM